MAQVRVKMSSAGAQALLKSAALQADMLRRAQAVAARANGMMSSESREKSAGYVADVIAGKTRARAAVKPADVIARRDAYKNNTLLKALGAGSD